MTDTHDTNLPEKPVELEEEKKAAEVSEPATTETPAEEIVSEKPVEPVQKLTKEEILAKLKEVVADVENVAKPEIDGLKQSFYKLHNAEQDAVRKLFIENGGAAENFVPQTDCVEEEFKNIMSVIKEKRSALTAELEKQKEMNLQVKLSIIEELKELVESPDDANKSYTEFKKLQQQWNEVKLVPQAKVNELWKNYQLYVEKFYDLLKLNNEFREYDFKKNLEIKTHLCEAAEKLADEADVVSAFHQLQKLHQEFRDTGPVAKELRDEIWARFKAASTTVNRRAARGGRADQRLRAGGKILRLAPDHRGRYRAAALLGRGNSRHSARLCDAEGDARHPPPCRREAHAAGDGSRAQHHRRQRLYGHRRHRRPPHLRPAHRPAANFEPLRGQPVYRALQKGGAAVQPHRWHPPAHALLSRRGGVRAHEECAARTARPAGGKRKLRVDNPHTSDYSVICMCQDTCI